MKFLKLMSLSLVLMSQMNVAKAEKVDMRAVLAELEAFEHIDNYSQAKCIAEKAMNLVNSLLPYASDWERTQYLTPIRKSAALLIAAATNFSDTSTLIGQTIRQLKSQIDRADQWILTNIERTSLTQVATDFLTLKYEIERALL